MSTRYAWSRLLLALLLGALVAVSPTASSSSAEPASEIKLVGAIERTPAEALAIFGKAIIPDGPNDPRRLFAGTMLAFPEVRQLWQFWQYTAPDSTKRTAVAIRSLDTLRIDRTLTFRGWLLRGTTTAPNGEFMHAIDPGKRVFFITMASVVEKFEVIEFDLKTLAETRWPGLFPGDGVSAFAGLRLGALAYDPFSNAVLGLAGGPSGGTPGNVNTYLLRRELTPTATTTVRQVGSCTGPLPSTDFSTTYGIQMLLAADFLYIPCHRAGYAGAVVRLPRATAFTPGSLEDVAVGPVYLEAALADPPSGRLFLITIKGEIWAFDTRTMSYVGVISAHAAAPSNVAVGYGLDPETGRLFFQSATYGVGIAEGRFFPIPQALTLPTARFPGKDRILSDARTGRFFVLTKPGTAQAPAYDVYAMPPTPRPPAAPDPDRSTIDREEQKGVTVSRYFANSGGYGFRALLANGISTVVPAPTAGVLAPTAMVIAKHVNSKCGFSDREMAAGRVLKAEYDGGSTAAAAIAVGVDERTKLDLERPSRCDFTVKDTSQERFSGIFSTFPAQLGPHDKGPGWNRDPASCTSSAGEEEGAKTASGDDHGQAPLGASKVECPVPGAGTLNASAEGSMAGGVAVGKAHSQTSIKKTPRGVLSESTAVARDIDIAGVIKIDEVKSVATSLANGRPSENDLSTHVISISGLEIAGQQVCPKTCSDIAAAVAELNRAGAGRAQFRSASGVDEDLRRGTPKGALTAVQKSTERQASDQALVGDFTTEVPALEMVVFNDNTEWGRARQLYQFAGVATVAGYTIALDPSGGDGFFSDDANGGDDDGNSEFFGDAGIAGFEAGSGFDGATSELAGTSSSDDGDAGNPIAQAFRALARGIRLFFTNPRHALLLFTAWALFSLPAVLSRRRRLLASARGT
ncbi:MAG: hypothetical protein KY395_00395 [Actinobacteria bacterium]|nr:hypothetical protein [Actinomycetota bacterium]